MSNDTLISALSHLVSEGRNPDTTGNYMVFVIFDAPYGSWGGNGGSKKPVQSMLFQTHCRKGAGGKRKRSGEVQTEEAIRWANCVANTLK